MFITQWSTLLPMTDFYPHLPSHLDLYCKSCSYFTCSFFCSVCIYTFPVLRTIIAFYVWLLIVYVLCIYQTFVCSHFITVLHNTLWACVLCVCCVLCILLCKLYHVLVPVSLSQTVIRTRCHVSPMNIYQFIILLVLPWPCSSALGHLGHFHYAVLACWKWSNDWKRPWKWGQISWKTATLEVIGDGSNCGQRQPRPILT